MCLYNRKVTFEKYSFRIPLKLMFEKGGNKQSGEYLFVNDTKENYLISFETGMQRFDLTNQNKKNLCCEEYADSRMKVNFCYPENQNGSRGYMVYFYAELLDANGFTDILPGQMNISPGNVWSAKAKRILLDLLSSVKVNESLLAG